MKDKAFARAVNREELVSSAELLGVEFAEHIDGFYGKAKTKSTKKQSDENMLWRRCLKAKEVEGDSGSSRKKKKKKRGGCC